jgi:hypothetical protein
MKLARPSAMADYRKERTQRRSMRSFHHQIERPCALQPPRSALA